MPFYAGVAVLLASLYVVGGIVKIALPAVLQGGDVLGKPPVRPAEWTLAKLAMFAACGWAPAAVFFPQLASYVTPGWLAVLGAVLYAVGALGVVLAGRDLGMNLTAGLPRGNSALKTNGLYGISRNPIYTGLLFLVLGSALFAPHPVNWLAGALCVVLHHRIILAEEVFLARRFGSGWRVYRSTVRRYL